eukprot:g8757.t1
MPPAAASFGGKFVLIVCKSFFGAGSFANPFWVLSKFRTEPQVLQSLEVCQHVQCGWSTSKDRSGKCVHGVGRSFSKQNYEAKRGTGRPKRWTQTFTQEGMEAERIPLSQGRARLPWSGLVTLCGDQNQASLMQQLFNIFGIWVGPGVTNPEKYTDPSRLEYLDEKPFRKLGLLALAVVSRGKG